MKKRNHIEGAMRSHNLVLLVVLVLTAVGIWSLPKMNKDEFPPVSYTHLTLPTN